MMIKFLHFYIFLSVALLISSTESDRIRECGKRSDEVFYDKNITATLEDAPWHAVVLRQAGTDLIFICSGVLVHPSLVMTSGRCVEKIQLKDIKIALKTTNLYNILYCNDDNNPLHSVINKFSSYELHDVAAEDDIDVYLQLDTPANTAHVCLIPVGSNWHTFINRKQCFVTGWGTPTYRSRHALRRQQERCELVLKKKGRTVREYTCDDSFTVFERQHTWSDASLRYIVYRNYLDNEYEVCPMQAGFPLKKADTVLIETSTCAGQQSNRIYDPEIHFCVTSEQSIARQVDVGSPIVCELKRLARRRNHPEKSFIYRYLVVGFVSSITPPGLNNHTIIATSCDAYYYKSDILPLLSKHGV